MQYTPDFEVWMRYVQRHLDPLLGMFRPELGRPHGLARGVNGGLDGELEWTLPWGMDDGSGNVRLTLVEGSRAPGGPLSVRVVVYAASRGFMDRRVKKGQLFPPLPRYGSVRDGSVAQDPEPEPERLPRAVAEYLLVHTSGSDAGSLRPEPKGGFGFTVVVAEAVT